MSKQKLLIWLFPEITDSEPEKTEPITTKQFLFMSIVGISLIVLCELFLK